MVEEKAKWIGYSKGVAYPLFNTKENLIGLCEIEGYSTLQWCKFEIIERIK